MTSGTSENKAQKLDWVRIVLLAKFDVIRCLARPESRQIIASVRRFITTYATQLLEAIPEDNAEALDAEANRLAAADVWALDLKEMPGAYADMARLWDQLRASHAHPDEVAKLHAMIESEAMESPDRLLDQVECAHWLSQMQMACQFYLRAPLSGEARSEAQGDPLASCTCDQAQRVIDAYAGVLFSIIRQHARPDQNAVVDAVAAAFIQVTHLRLDKCRQSNWPPTPLLMDLLKLDPSHVRISALKLNDPAISEAWDAAVLAAHADGRYWHDLVAARRMLHDRPEIFVNSEKDPASITRLFLSCVDAAQLTKEQLPAAVEAVKQIRVDYFGHGKVALQISFNTFVVGTEAKVIREHLRAILEHDDSPVIRVNLRYVKQVSSMTLSLLIEISREVEAHNRELVFEGVAGELQELFEVTRFSKRFAVINNPGWSIDSDRPSLEGSELGVGSRMPLRPIVDLPGAPNVSEYAELRLPSEADSAYLPPLPPSAPVPRPAIDAGPPREPVIEHVVDQPTDQPVSPAVKPAVNPAVDQPIEPGVGPIRPGSDDDLNTEGLLVLDDDQTSVSTPAPTPQENAAPPRTTPARTTQSRSINETVDGEIKRKRLWAIVQKLIILAAIIFWCVQLPVYTWVTKFFTRIWAHDPAPQMTLEAAVKQSNVAEVEANLLKGASANWHDTQGLGLLSAASMKGDLAVVKLLIEHGAKVSEPDASGRTPLHWAAASGRSDIAGYLIDVGANVDAVDLKGGTPLSEAKRFGHSEMVSLLQKHHAADGVIEPTTKK